MSNPSADETTVEKRSLVEVGLCSEIIRLCFEEKHRGKSYQTNFTFAIRFESEYLNGWSTLITSNQEVTCSVLTWGSEMILSVIPRTNVFNSRLIHSVGESEDQTIEDITSLCAISKEMPYVLMAFNW